MNINVQEHEFKAEMKQLLNLIIHSLYTHPEVFIRELVSNASDALSKARFRRLTDSEILEPEAELKINIHLDKENKIFTIEDSGIGMSDDDLITQLGTIAKSGTLEFLKKVAEEQKSIDAQLIGQFGVGFYSVFMVTDEITVETRSANQDSKSYRWKSNGEERFTIEEIDQRSRGTKIYFKLKEEHSSYCEDWKVKSILKKYSNFVDFPVTVNNEDINTVSALWHRKKEEIKQDELDEFYKFISNDTNTPLAHLHVSIEGNINFKSLLFIPENAPPTMFQDSKEKSVSLYSKRVFIQDDAKDLLPDYLKFIRGVVDTEDISLNVSREFTQNSPLMNKMKNVLTGKILTWFEELAENDKTKFNTLFKNFGAYLKLGLNQDFTNKSRLIELIRFETSVTGQGNYSSFNDYVNKMSADQTEIYYINADNRDRILRNPNLEYFNKKGIEVIYLFDPVDVFTIPYINDYKGKQLKSIDKSDIDFKDDSAGSDEKLNKDISTALIEKFKQVLGDKVEDVCESVRLVDSPATLVVGKQGFDPQMEKMMQMLDKDYTASKRILEINTSHKIIKNLSLLMGSDSNEHIINDSIETLYDSAMLLEGYLKAPQDFIKRMNNLLEIATTSK
ncbi:MAG: molecular chaperone HtpG [Candidatus Kapabacteria bacterium]|nr:molecular chaperone HtpG [Candidatus Kapabacteria bacterium]